MADPQDELAALRAQIAALTARIYRLEEKSGLDSPPPSELPGVIYQTTPPSPRTSSVAPIQQKPSTPVAPRVSAFAVEEERDSDELESKIGKLWLNRIGIIAILTGVSYFIKYAF